MEFREVIVTNKKHVKVPDGWKVEHSYVIPAKQQHHAPKFAVLMSKDEHSKRHDQKESAIGFDVWTTE